MLCALYLLIVCPHKSTSYQLWILREIVLLLLPGQPLPQICSYTQTHTQPTDSSNCEGWVDGLSCWFRLKLFQHTKFFDPKLFLFCTCEYYISSIHSYHNMILIIPMHRQTDSQTLGENPILKHNHHHHHRIMLEPIHSMNVPVRPFVLNPKTKRGLQYWQTLIRDGVICKCSSQKDRIWRTTRSPHSATLYPWMGGEFWWLERTHTHDIHRILANMNI